MATGWEMLPDAAKALSAPMTKLVEVVAAGCGRIYGPTDIRRTARAEADAAVLLAEADARRSEIAVRAAQRVLDIEESRQANIESITAIAAKQLPNEVSERSVEKDWATRFFREAQDISNEQMQQLWAKLLAGEVAKPGAFSVRTLSVASNLSPAEAQQFGAVCRLVGKVANHGLGLFLTNLNAPYMIAMGLSYDSFEVLEAAGLVLRTEMSVAIASDSAHRMHSIERPGDLLLVAKSTTADTSGLPLGQVALTPAGAELFAIADWAACSDHDNEIVQILERYRWKVEKKLIVGRTATGTHGIPWPK